jgi:RNA polymerase sigma factor FliA
MISMQGVPSSLIARHESWVRKQASALSRRLPANVEKADLIQAGLIGVAQAAMNFQWEGDPDSAEGREAFLRYAQLRVKGAMLDELRQMDWLPRSARKSMRQIEAAIHALQQRLGRSPSEIEVAGELKVPIDIYHEMLFDARGAQLLHYEDFGSGEEDDFLERNCADNDSDPLVDLLDGDLRQTLIGAIDALPEREKTLMGLYYERELNFKEIGAILGVSESRVCQMHSQAIARLRARLKECAWTSIA